MDEERGEGQQTTRHQVDRPGLHEDARKLRHIRQSSTAREHRGGTRLIAGTSAAEADFQTKSVHCPSIFTSLARCL